MSNGSIPPEGSHFQVRKEVEMPVKNQLQGMLAVFEPLLMHSKQVFLHTISSIMMSNKLNFLTKIMAM
jgi:hypothetical protein